MSAGLLVIATGHKEVFIKHKKNGLLYESWSPRKIALDLKEIIYSNDVLFNIKKNARKYSLRHFSIKKHSLKTLKFFKSFN